MASSEDFDDFDQEIHQRLLENDTDAPSQLVHRYLKGLLRYLKSEFKEVKDQTLIHDAAVDACVNYIKNPLTFDPTKRNLFSYLKMSAKGDLLNALKKEESWKNAKQKIVKNMENEVLQSTINNSINLPEEGEYVIKQDVITQVIEEFPDLRDQQILWLILDRERKTSVYAEILEIQDRDEVEQRRIVKQNKDRIKKRLERLGVKLRG